MDAGTNMLRRGEIDVKTKVYNVIDVVLWELKIVYAYEHTQLWTCDVSFKYLYGDWCLVAHIINL